MEQLGLTEQTTKTPLAASQLRHWLLSQNADRDTSINHVTYAVRINGELDTSRLINGLYEVLERHRILTMHLDHHVSGPSMCLVNAIKPLVSEDLIAAGQSEQQYVESCADSPQFDLKTGPLIRTHLAKTITEAHLLVLVAHRLAADYLSLNIVVREVLAVYAGKSLIQSPHPFVEFALADNKARTARQYKNQLDYWHAQLADIEPAELNLDFKPPTSRNFSAAQIEFELNEKSHSRVIALAKEMNSTAHAVLLAGYLFLLQLNTRSHDIAIATTVHGRNNCLFKDTVGAFEGILPIRTQLDTSLSFRSLIIQVTKTLEDAINNSDVSFDEIVQRIKPPRVPDQLPFSPYCFSMREDQELEKELENMQWLSIDVATKTSEHDLLLEIKSARETDGRSYRGRFVYSDELYQNNSIRRFCEQYQRLLDQGLSQPNTPISQLQILSQREEQVLISELNPAPTRIDTSKNLADLIWQQAQQHPDTIAVRDDASGELSFRQLTRQAEKLAIHLQQLGAGPGVLVALSVNRSASMLVALLGILRSGSAYLPMDPTYPAERVQYILHDASAPILITEQSLKDTLPSTDANVICLESDWLSTSKAALAGKTLDDSACAKMHDLAYVIYTSGSTGKPKGVQLTQLNVLNFLLSMQHKPGLTPDDKLLAVTTLSFDISVLELFLPLITGAQVVIASRELASDGQRLASFLDQEKITVLQATPTTWRLLLESGWAGRPELTGLMGGEAMPTDLLPRLLPKLCTLWNMYGPTETTVWSTCHQITDATGTVSIGKPIANTRVYILNDQLQLCPLGTSGELCIAGDGVSLGYSNREDLNTTQFLTDPFCKEKDARLYRTGDLARWQGDGNLIYLGRLDNLVKLNGYRIELGEIESVFSSHEEVAQCAVMVREDMPGNKRLVAYWVANDNATTVAVDERFQQHLAKKLPAYMIPQQFVPVPSMPLTPNGKLDRKALPAPSLPMPSKEPAPLETETQQEIALQWQKLIGATDIVPSSNFFRLGGHSLVATKFIHWVENHYGSKLPMRTLIMGSLSQVATRLDPTSDSSVDLSQIDSNAQPEISVQNITNGALQLFCTHVRHRQKNHNALLMVASHGYEQSRTDRSYRSLAIELAKQNVHSMRLDLSGTGNSSLASTDVNSLRQWRSDIRCAAKVLLEQSGCSTISVLAGRFTASLLDNELFESIELEQAFLWDPIVSGERWWQARLKLYRDMTTSGFYYLKPRIVSDPKGLQTPGLSINTQLRADIDAFKLDPSKLDKRFHVLLSSDSTTRDYGSANIIDTADNLNWYDTLACSSTDIDSFDMRRYVLSAFMERRI